VDYEGVPVLDMAAVQCEDGTVTIFAVNRDMQEDLELQADLRAFGANAVKEHIVLHHDDVKVVNTKLNPDCVSPVSRRDGMLDAAG